MADEGKFEQGGNCSTIVGALRTTLDNFWTRCVRKPPFGCKGVRLGVTRPEERIRRAWNTFCAQEKVLLSKRLPLRTRWAR